ncbi:MAG: HAMP domain-containing histidine kinase [Leptothrix sp. (in: Bacteria)]|jgi:two-component system sensor histidine kinase QseC|nr:HAMP domain-containing histidine kinase [Leptothrix sp. (in: b-proteobacteria)]HQY08156.1 HAMP domain-containing sensor histidine kinase [Burkholderiaceae bacterium]
MRRTASLQGRLLKVMLAALAAVVLVLVALDYAEFKAGVSARLAQQSAAQGLGEALAEADETVAAAIVRATELQFNRTRRASGLAGIEDLHFQLQTPDGRVVYRSAGLSGAPAWTPQQMRWDVLQVQQRPYWPWLQETPRWRILLLEPVVQDTQVLRWLGAGLLPSILVALPLLGLPLWWAVRTGLAPLRRLVAAVSRRDAADLSPLQLDLRYAELQPIVGAIDGLLARARQHVEHERVLLQHTAHEMRTPLAVVAAQAHALSSAPEGVAADAARQGIQRAVQRASHLVEQLLDLARLESPGPAAAPERVDLVTLCRQHVIDLTALADARGIEMALVSPEHCHAAVPLPALHSILDNLLRNALNHCPSGALVELQLGCEGGCIRIDVLDDGPGMPAEERAQAFERFFRGRAAGPGTGTGLGLAIVKEAARLLGGQASLAEGVGGKGLRARVEWRTA